MSNLVEINNTELSVKEFNGQRVITFKDIDNVHNRPDGTARMAFNRNRKRLVINEDYFIIKPKDIENTQLNTKRSIKNQMGISCQIENSTDENLTLGIYQVSPRGTTFITKTGYLMLVKTFDDDLAWKVQRELVSSYFKAKESTQEQYIDMSPFIESITSLSSQMTILTEEMAKLKESQSKPKLPASKYSRWKTNTFNKLKLIQSYVNDNSDQSLSLPQTIKLVFDELQDTYNIEISDYDEMYKCEYGLDLDTKVQTLDIINHYKDIRDMFTLTLNSILERLHLENEPELKSTRNIFDELAAKLENEKVS